MKKNKDMIQGNPEVSILVCTYNRRKFLEKNLESIFKQTFRNYEIIIIDDGSTDSTEKFVKSLKDERVVYHRNTQNMGGEHGDWIHVHRVLYELMRGKYFIYLCDDDYWHTDYVLETLVDKFHKHPNLALAFGMHAHIFPKPNNEIHKDSRVTGIKNCYTAKGMFPEGYMPGLDYLDFYSSAPCHRNCLEGASLFSKEKMLACQAFKDPLPQKNWQGGYMFKMGIACMGDVFFIDEPYVIATVLDTGQSFARTHRDHFNDGASAILQSYQFLKEGLVYKQMPQERRSKIKELYIKAIKNYVIHWLINQVYWKLGTVFFGCSAKYFEKRVRLIDILRIFKVLKIHLDFRILKYCALSAIPSRLLRLAREFIKLSN